MLHIFKIAPLAAAITLLPMTRQTGVYNNGNTAPATDYSFLYRIKPVDNPFVGNNKKPAQEWDQQWLNQAQENIRKAEYDFTLDKKRNAYHTPNRIQNLRFYYTGTGFSVQPRTTKIPVGNIDPQVMNGDVQYKTIAGWKVQFNLNKKQVNNGKWQIVNNTAAYITKAVTVQYINNDEGMRQNFIVHQPLSKTKKISLRFTVTTRLRTKLFGNGLHFDLGKQTVLKYDGLKVFDANGKALNAAIVQKGRQQYAIEVVTTDAAYPITIDPLSSTPAAYLQSNNTEARMGFSVSSAGDVNGDGYSDVLIGAYFYNSSYGAFYVYHGSATGISTTPATFVVSPTSATQLAFSVCTAGDVNGDGYSDIVIGVPFYRVAGSPVGALWLYYGSPTGIGTTADVVEPGDVVNSLLGVSVACAGDVNGDGYSDVIAGAPGYVNGEALEGAMYVFLGSVSGLNHASKLIIESNSANAGFARVLGSAGDVDGDGYSDVIAGANNYTNGQTNEGAFYIFRGSAAGIITTPVTMVESNSANIRLGSNVSTAGDVNGDGYSDVLVGAPYYVNGQSNEGAAWLYYGSAAGINTTPAMMVEGNAVNAGMSDVGCLGDINGDGYSDFAVGVSGYNNGQFNEGAVYIYYGSAGTISSTPATIIESNSANAIMSAVASAGDVNGDGYSDVVIGASQLSDGETREGAAFVYHGSPSGLNTTATAMMETNQVNGNMTSIASAGDINGDGYSDVVAGASGYDGANANEGIMYIFYGTATGISSTPGLIIQRHILNEFFGSYVAGAGDVNGDGYSDVVTGTIFYSNGQLNEGGVFVYLGSAAGLNTSPAIILESNIPAAGFGRVACAGDVNGDGYSDIIAGQANYSNGQTNEGAAFIYQGSATGINATPSTTLESNTTNALMGWAVAGAGDVNGDSYSDVIVGAMAYNNGQAGEGAFFVYLGSATGVNTTPVAMVESNLAGAQLGWSVASAGDVNGDGKSDIIVGANDYTNGETYEGAFFVYHGTATGINTTPAFSVESNNANAHMGISVATAGDVNGDGYSDIVVGASSYTNGQSFEGAAFIYHGSATGITGTAAATMECNVANAGFGASVASAGDINGDGYSDVGVAAWSYTNGEINEGALFVYQGNSTGTNKRNNLRLYNADLTTPINSSNFIFANFGAGLYARSFLGRSKAKMVWETRFNYDAYSGSPITNSTAYTSQQSSYSDLGINGAELKNIVNKIGGAGFYTKLRARVKYNPATAVTGQLYGPWRNVSAVIDGNKTGVLPLRLISFKAAWQQKGQSAQINFTTDKESGTCCFDIEKSVDGFNYTSIAAIPSRNDGAVQSYSFVDNNAKDKHQYYRLKIKGMQGQVEYSSIEHLQYGGTATIFIFPNPTTDVLQLQLNDDEKVSVQIVNPLGQVVKQINNIVVTGRVIQIPVANLKAGNYWIRLNTGQEQQVLQFVKK